MGTLENFNVHNLNDSNNKMTKEQVRDKVHKDKNIENAIKNGVENYLDSIMKQLYSDTANSEYEYLSEYTLITTEIFEDGYVISDVHIDVNMIIYDYSSKNDGKMERYIALNNNYLMGLNLKFKLKNINDDIEDIEVRYFNIYGFTDNLKK
ncbi:hypothetical protein [Brachyspira alvinipulli]|uniref:hypothetical protein n=1 Tax=Brachyspira alvinipulli TaxID=84379 RepID=UPI0004AFDF57|nr:hypothetical protein [Brachyspira alvinipulli]